MLLDDLTSAAAVRAAMDEYDRLGSEVFLAKYGYKPARSYRIVDQGKTYDSKAIAGVALGKQFPTRGPLRSTDFSGGAATVQRKLEELGFTMEKSVPEGRLNLSALQKYRELFLSRTPGFTTFRSPGEIYLQEERRYKDELRQLFRAEVLSRAKAGGLDDALAEELAAAYRSVLLRKLPSIGRAQNLVSWQVSDKLKRNGQNPVTELGHALNRLLTATGPAVERIVAFTQESGTALRKVGSSGPFGKARLIGSCAMMLAEPDQGVVIRTDVWERATTVLTGSPFPSFTDEADRIRVAHRLASDIHEVMTDDWGWMPADMIDVQSFIWIAQDRSGLADSKDGSSDQPAARRFWIEKTIVEGRPDRQGGEHALGQALWSPKTSKDGRNIYVSMLQVQPGDVVFHLTDNSAISDVAEVAQGADESFTGVPGTEWEGQPSYRIQLHSHERLAPVFPREAFLETEPYATELRELAESGAKGLFYNSRRGLNQGAYLTEATPTLLAILNRAYEQFAGKPLPYLEPTAELVPDRTDYTIDDALETLFMEREEVEELLQLWAAKKNIILQGPPGVGKSYASQKLAFALMGAEDRTRLGFVQFHQSYSYEDFVEGYRPSETGFELRSGKFVEFCRRAEADPSRRYVFIIDEINRGNLSKILGELMLLIESDKRDVKWAMPLASGKVAFHVPPNVYLMGLMNTADRSLAVVDYALRRRFAFVDLKPKLHSEQFAAELLGAGVEQSIVDKLLSRVGALNAEIVNDLSNLGPGFAIGHSFFCGGLSHTEDGEAWFARIMRTEIAPLLREYWFDNPGKADEWAARLVA